MNGSRKHVPNRRRARRWPRIAAIAVLIAGGAVMLAAVFILLRPDALQPVLEKALSAASGLTVRYRSLSLEPGAGVLQIEKLRISSDRPNLNLNISIPRLRLHYQLAGRTLVLQEVALQAPVARFGPRLEFPQPAAGPHPPPAAGSPLQWPVSAVLVSQVRLQSLTASAGRLQWDSGPSAVRLDGLTLELQESGRLTIEAGASIGREPSRPIAVVERLQAELTGLGATEINGRLRLTGGKVAGKALQAETMSLNVDAAADLTSGEIEIRRAHLLAQASFRNSPPHSISLTGSGTYRPSSGAATLSSWQLTVAELLEASGQARRLSDSHPGFTVRVQSARLDTEKTQALLEEYFGKSFSGLDISGPLAFQATVEGSTDLPPGSWQTESIWTPDNVRVDFRRNDVAALGRLGGRMQLSGALLDPVCDLQLTFETETLRAAGMDIQNARTEIAGRGSWRSPRVSVTTQIAALQLAGDPRYGLHRIRLAGKNGRLNLANASFHWPELTVTSEETGRFQGTLRADGHHIDLQLESPVAQLHRLVRAWQLVPENWQVAARDRLQLSLHWRPRGRGTVKARLEAADLKFSSPDGRVLAENVAFSADLDGRISAAGTEASLSATATAGEVLWTRYYLDLAADMPAVAGKAAYRVDSRVLDLESWKLKLQPQLELSVSGSVGLASQRPAAHFDIRTAETPLGPLVSRWLVEPYRYEHPELESVEIEGLFTAALQLRRKTAGWSASGRASLHRGNFRDPHHHVALEGVELDLPLRYEPASAAAPETNAARGSLSVEQLSLPFVPVQPLAVDFTVAPNRIHLPRPLTLELKSGRITAAPTRFAYLDSGKLLVESGLQFDKIELDPYLETIWPQFGGGVLNGRLREIRYRDRQFTSQGTLHAEVFGGHISLNDIRLLHPFSSIATLRLDASLRSLSLEALTAGTAFGKIEGVLEGNVQNLEIVGGQPQRFDLLLQTVRRSGVDQSINIRAVENIARIGGGQSPFVGGMAGLFGSFFKEFGYRKIGVRASLKNDVFHINGTIHENGTEYLVKRGGLPGVDVINSNPDNRIRFKDMVKRIQRIGSTSTGPVIR